MIVDFFLDLLTALIIGIFDLLPDWSLDLDALSGESGGDLMLGTGTVVTSHSSPLATILHYAQMYNNYLPIDQLFVIVSILTTLFAAILAYKLGKWIIGVFRGSGTT